MVSDEAGSGRLYWNDLRITGGTEPLEFGANNSGRGVGGSTIHYAGFARACIRPTSASVAGRCRRRLAAFLRGPGAVLRGDGARIPGVRPGPLSVGQAARLSVRAAASGHGRAEADRGLCQAGHSGRRGRAGGDPSRADPANGRTASCAASACWAARSAPRAARWSAIFRTRSSTAPRSAPGAWPTKSRSTPKAASPAFATSARGDDGRRIEEQQHARAVIVAGYAIESPRLLLNSHRVAFPRDWPIRAAWSGNS